MKIIIISLLMTFALCQSIAISTSADSTGCTLDVTATGTGAVVAATDFYLTIVECTTAVTTQSVSTLNTASCEWWGIDTYGTSENKITVYVAAASGTVADATKLSEVVPAATTALTGCTQTAYSATGPVQASTVCTGAVTLTAGNYYYTTSSDDDTKTLGTSTFSTLTNGCEDSSDSSMITMSFAALASVF